MRRGKASCCSLRRHALALLHVLEANPDGPDIGTGLRDHQDTDQRDGISPEDNRHIEGKAQDDGQPEEAESRVCLLVCALVEQDDDQQPQQGKRDVPVDAPGQRRMGAGPCVLGKQAEGNAGGCQQIDGARQQVPASDRVALPPDLVEDDIEDGHGDRGDELADAKRDGKMIKPDRIQGDGPRHQVE
ncbi:hypothetical protein SDC9_181862 [bioreactor metagenome]|uniref:Uncharacterized protein n=1 Tax=bioreactor metagenome TaxID=1076179 RepID=A0A645H8F2_9ZZZZ